MKLFLIRHGESEAVAKGVNGGWSTCHLTQTGIQEAKKTAAILQNQKIDYFFVSDLQRTEETAFHITRNHPESQIIFDERIRERNMGDFEGKPRGSMAAHCMEHNLDIVTFKPKGGQSIAEHSKQVHSFFHEIKQTYQQSTICLITHGGVITNLLLYLTQDKEENYRKYHPHPCSIAEINVTDKEVKIIRMNDTSHL